jgi:hypothetical protein
VRQGRLRVGCVVLCCRVLCRVVSGGFVLKACRAWAHVPRQPRVLVEREESKGGGAWWAACGELVGSLLVSLLVSLGWPWSCLAPSLVLAPASHLPRPLLPRLLLPRQHSTPNAPGPRPQSFPHFAISPLTTNHPPRSILTTTTHHPPSSLPPSPLRYRRTRSLLTNAQVLHVG